MSSALFNRRLLLASISCSTLIASGVHANPPVLEPVIVTSMDGAPPGFPGLFWNLSSTFSNSQIDESGKIVFAGVIFGDGVTPANNRVLWHGETGNWTVLGRSGDSVPTPLAPLTWSPLNNSNPAISPNGMVSVSGTMAGAGITTANDTAAWMGAANNPVLAIREGDIAPGTAGASFNMSMALGAGTRANNAGQIMIASALIGGDTITTPATSANNAGVYLAGPSGVTKVWRKRDPAPGAPALPATDGPFIQHDTFGLHLNGSGAVAMTGTLVAGTVVPTPPLTADNDRVVFVAENGVPRYVARENDLVPGIADTTYKIAGTFTLAQRALNNSGKVLFNAFVAGPSVTTANDSIWLLEDHGVVTTVLREGDTLGPGTFSVANFTNTLLNNNDRIAFACTVNTGTSVPSMIIEGPAGGPYTIVAVQGDPVPGLTGVNMDISISSANLAYNNANQIVFSSNLNGPGVTLGVDDRGLFAWDAGNGLQMIARTGVTQVQGLLDLAILSLIGGTGQNGECGSTILTDNGWLTFTAQDVKGFRALIRTQLLLPDPECTADIDGNDMVDVNDLLAVITTWGACPDPKNCPGDIAPAGGNDMVDVNDLLAVITTWGACP